MSKPGCTICRVDIITHSGGVKNRASPVDLNTNDEHADLYEKWGGLCGWLD